MKGVEQIGAFVASRGDFSFDNQQRYSRTKAYNSHHQSCPFLYA
ncbi:hypothetical protein glysoja_046351 [Glycine soja]|uniref:Uncharacterized protein n=1 Tax=Glycine soja TaxID=3848 RepID=A0A0B2PX56_GLYSO|nr:hypothetical protein glysoja_046351 [Glycine soja]